MTNMVKKSVAILIGLTLTATGVGPPATPTRSRP